MSLFPPTQIIKTSTYMTVGAIAATFLVFVPMPYVLMLVVATIATICAFAVIMS